MLAVAPLFAGGGCAVLAHTVLTDRVTRSRVTGNSLWKMQFFCHPLIVGAWLLYPQWLPPLLLVPFVFNWGVEPWDLPRDAPFFACFYAHHLAPLLASMVLAASASDEGALASRGWRTAQALLFAHCWLLHTLGDLHHRALVDKQRWFWPYTGLGFALHCRWWSAVAAAVAASSTPAPLWLMAGPVLLQYAGRWGLYARLLALFPTMVGQDAFEERKLPAEAASLVVSLLLVLLLRLYA